MLSDVAAAVRANTRRLIREAVEAGGCDFAAEIASRIPMTTISNLLGVPEQDRDYLLAQTKAALSADTEDVDEVDSEMARNEILLYFMDMVEERRAAPGDDVISMLVASSIDGVPLSDEDIVLNCYSLIIGGDETSRLTMIDGVHTLAARPEQWRRLKDGEVAIDTAVDEVLRWASPTMHFGRTVVRETEVHGVRLRPGEIVTLWHASGNRDERVFERPGSSTSAAPPTSIWPSATARTSASAPIWPRWRSPNCSWRYGTSPPVSSRPARRCASGRTS